MESRSPASGAVHAALPLALMESVRTHDRPVEVLEDEDLTLSLPRRFGMSTVMLKQIQLYESASRAGKSVPLEEFLGLIRLVLKRPDAADVLREAGNSTARHYFNRVPKSYVKALRILPKALLHRAYRKLATRMLRGLSGAATVEVTGRPPVVRISESALSSLDPAGSACVLYAAALEELGDALAGHRPTVLHTRCVGTGEAACEWTVESL